MYTILQVPYDGSCKVPGCRVAPSKIIDYAIAAGYGLEKCKIEFCSIVNQSEKISLNNIETKFSQLYLSDGGRILTIGGNHIITYPILNSLRKRSNNFSLIYFDAHSDTDYNIIPTNSSFISYFRQESPGTSITNIGLRFKEESMLNGINVIPSSVFYLQNNETIIDSLIKKHKDEPVYISIDIDVLDPCFAPGVSSPIGGGIATAQLNLILGSLLRNLNIIAIDLTEYNPYKDRENITLPSILSILWEIHKAWSK